MNAEKSMDLETYATRLAARVAMLEQELVHRESLIALLVHSGGGKVEVSKNMVDELDGIERVTWTVGDDGSITFEATMKS